MSDQGFEKLRLLNKRLEELFDRYNELRTKNMILKDENDVLKRYLDERDRKVKELETRYERLKISGALMGEGRSAVEAKGKINELVREIDKCVALLNR